MKSINNILKSVYEYGDMIDLNREDLSGKFIQDMTEVNVAIKEICKEITPNLKELRDKAEATSKLADSTMLSFAKYRRSTTLELISVPKCLSTILNDFKTVENSVNLYNIDFINELELANVVSGDNKNLLDSITEYPNRVINVLNSTITSNIETISSYKDGSDRFDLGDPEAYTNYAIFKGEDYRFVDKTKDVVIFLKKVAEACKAVITIMQTIIIEHCNKTMSLDDQLYTFSKTKIAEIVKTDKSANSGIYSTNTILVEAARCITCQVAITYSMMFSLRVLVDMLRKFVDNCNLNVKVILENI